MAIRGFVVWVGTAVLAVGMIVSASAPRANASPRGPTEGERAVAPLRDARGAPFGSFLGSCNSDTDCPQGNTCQSFRKRGNHCTHACEMASDCRGGPVARCTKRNRCGLNDRIETP
jgi:hypothetical protein